MSNLAIVSAATSPQPHHPPVDLRATVEELRRRHRRADEAELAELLVTRLAEDGDLLLEAATFVVNKTLMAIAAQQRRQQAAPNTRQRAERKVTEQAAVAEIVEKVKLAVLDLPITLMSGETKKLRFTTGSELAKLGSAYSRLAERVGADCLVGECCARTRPQCCCAQKVDSWRAHLDFMF